MPTLARGCAVLATAALLGACAGTPPPRLFALDGAPVAIGQKRSPSVVVSRVELPEMSDRPQLVVRSGDHRVLLDENRRWAEPLRRAVPRLLAADLGARLDSAAVLASATEAQTLDPDFRVSLDFRSFDLVAGEGARIDVSWRIDRRRGEAIIGASRITEAARPAGGDPDADRQALIAALRRALAGVAVELATAIAAAPRPWR